jgi:hypothetical protein
LIRVTEPIENVLIAEDAHGMVTAFRVAILQSAKTFALATSRIGDWFVTWFEHGYV